MIPAICAFSHTPLAFPSNGKPVFSVNSIRKSVAVSFLGNNLQFAIHLLTTIIISRLLTPQEIGVFSVGAALIALLQTFRNLGTAQYLIQEKELTNSRIRSALTLAILTAWPIGAAAIFAADNIARFYATKEVGQIVTILSVNFFLLPFGAVATALLRREMQFVRLNIIQTAGALVAAVLSISLALVGFGPVGLALGAFCGTAFASLLTTRLAFRSARLLKPSLSELGRVFSFGSRTFGASLMTELGDKLPEIVIGKAQGLSSAAFFSRAKGAVQTFDYAVISAIQPVIIPAFAANNRNAVNMERSYLHAFDFVVGIGWPFYACLALLAPDAILILFGDQWDQAIQPAQILCLAFAVALPRRLGMWFLLATGRADLNLLATAIWFAAIALAVLAGAYFSIETVAFAIVLAEVVGLAIMHHQLAQAVRISSSALRRAYLRGVALALATAIPLAWTYSSMDGTTGYLLQLPTWGLAMLIGWILGIVVLRHPILAEILKLASSTVGMVRR